MSKTNHSGVQIIAVVGMAGAGKSESCAFFRERGVPVLRFGDQTEIGLKELRKAITPENERWYREKLRRELGMAAYAIKIMPRIKEEIEKGEKMIVLDGLYSWEEYLALKKKYPHLTLLCIYARPSIRYQRLYQRDVRRLTPEEARKRDFAELENLNKGGPIAIADYLIRNEGTKKQLETKLERFSKTINGQS